jgi:hypothetical protein
LRPSGEFGPWPSRTRCAPPRPGRNLGLGLGLDFPSPPGPRADPVAASRRSSSDGWPAISAGTKNRRASLFPGTLVSFLPSPLSAPHRAEERRRRRRRPPVAAEGSWRRRCRPPRRRARSAVGERVAVEWPCGGALRLSPRRSGTPVSQRLGPFFPRDDGGRTQVGPSSSPSSHLGLGFHPIEKRITSFHFLSQT